MKRLLIFGGTSEGRRLVQALQGSRIRLTVSVATDYGQALLPSGQPNLGVRCGRLNEEQMAELMREGYDLIVDATHPYAAEATRNILAAAQRNGLKVLRLVREQSLRHDCRYVDSADRAAAELAGTCGNILLTTGAKELSAFAALSLRLYPRVLPSAGSIERCLALGIPREHIIAMQGPFSLGLNRALMEQFAIRHLVTKDSGSAGGFEEKMRAAEELGVDAVVIGRPLREQGMTLEEILSAIEQEEKTCG